jgi:hypothetical protein
MTSVTADDFYLRRSTRKFQNKSVPKELLEKLIIAARNAPSVCDYFYVSFVREFIGGKLATLAILCCNKSRN